MSNAGQDPQRLLPRLILASSSPNRRAVLDDCGVVAEAVAADVNEEPWPDESAVELTTRLAEAKCATILDGLASQTSRSSEFVVIAADTMVECLSVGTDGEVTPGQVLGKPQSRDEAFDMLSSLSGTTHQVVTGVAVGIGHVGERADPKRLAGQPRIAVESDSTKVRFRKLDRAEIERYLDSGDYKGKAGAYGIQGIASVFVDQIEGSFHTVVGLPLHLVEALLSRRGWSLHDWRGG